MIVYADIPEEIDDFLYHFDCLNEKTAVITVLQEDENKLIGYNNTKNICVLNQINLHDKICGTRAKHIIFVKAGLMEQKLLQMIISGHIATKSNPIKELKRKDKQC